MTIKIFDLVSKPSVTKDSDGVKIFEHMKSASKKEPDSRQFELDCFRLSVVSANVFAVIRRNMSTKLNGLFNVVLVNANQLVANSFRQAFGV